MYNNCCHYPMPQQHSCCGITPYHVPMPCAPKPMPCCQMPEVTQFETCKQVMEPTTSCTQEFHHHHKVDHIVPVVVKNVHCHHNHHHYMIDKKECDETFCVDHGVRQEDWCNLAMTQCQTPARY